MSAREERARAKQQQILAAASVLFRERGFDGTSTDAVSARAGVSKETLYRHYPSKEQLLAAVMRDIAVTGTFTRPDVRLPARATRRDLEAVLVALATAALDRVLTPDYLALARLVIAESGRHPELASTFRQLVPEAGAAAIRHVLADAQEQGLLRADADLGTALQLFVGPLLLRTIAAMLAGTGAGPVPDASGDVTGLVRLFLDGAGAGAAA
jgi:TetR/AcrR family transcriptional repressor of mexJK operon